MEVEARPLGGSGSGDGSGNGGGKGHGACRFVGYDDEIVHVEEWVLQHLGREENGGWAGCHSEGRLWHMLFALLFFEEIFDDTVPHAFQMPFQRFPLDLFTDAFFAQRRGRLERRLREIADEVRLAEPTPEPWPVGNQVLEAWARHQGVAVLGASWDEDPRRFSAVDAALFATFLGGPSLAVVLRKLAEDRRHWSSGMPDLALWRLRADLPRGGEALVVEVKSKNDHLADRQKAWLRVLVEEAAINACVLRLRDPA